MADVAREAGVAPSTVSLVINDEPRVAEETRAAVRRAIRTLGYVPLRGGRPRGPRSVAGRTRAVTLVFVGRRILLKSPVYSEVLQGVERALSAHRYSMSVRFFCPDEGAAGPVLLNRPDGVLLFGGLGDEVQDREFRGLPVVKLMGQVLENSLYDHISYNNARLGELAAGGLLARGHRHVAVLAHWTAALMDERSSAFVRVIEAAGGCAKRLLDEQPMLVVGEQRHEVDLAVMRRQVDVLLRSEPRPTAVFLVMDMLVPAFYVALRERGLEPGRDIGVVGCNNERIYLDTLCPRPATIDIHAEAVGRRAVEQLLWRLDNPREPRVTLMLEPTLVEK